MSNRRADKASGFVNFPIGKDDWRNTGEGGMFVNLVVEQKDHDDNNCCGMENVVQIAAIFTECLIKHGEDEFKTDQFGQERWVNEKYEANLKEHFPKMWEYDYDPASDKNPNTHKNKRKINIWEAVVSQPYVAAITIAHTGWSGYSDSRQRPFEATYDDLTYEGRALWALMVKLYPKGKISLLTWLDT